MMISNEVIWVTGASSGIGKAVALQLAKQGNKVIASGRNTTKLSSLASESTNIVALETDLTAMTAADIQTQLSSHTDHLDRIFLCAGDCLYFEIEQPQWQIMKQVMEINFHGTVMAIEAALPLLTRKASAQHKGHIIAVSSLATAAPFPKAEAYGASKAALSYFLSSLRLDLANRHIDVTDIQPGFIDTPLTRKNDFDMPFLMNADQAAQRIVSNLEARPFKYIFPRRLHWLFRLINLFPRRWLKKQSADSSQPGSINHG